MEGFWKKIGENFLSKIEIGSLEVVFPNKNIKTYGNNDYPKAKIYLNNYSVFKRILFFGDIGFAESYMDEDFECND